MNPLTQEYLEALLQNKIKDAPTHIVIFFTAKWCGPCNSLPLDKLVSLSNNLTWFLCDVDENQFSSGYCGVSSIPSMLGIVRGKPTKLVQAGNAQSTAQWLLQLASS
jgi:thioredoxin-like negative regulator of GroEL